MTMVANRRVYDKVLDEVKRLVMGYRVSLTRKLKDTKGFSSGNVAIDTMLEGMEYFLVRIV
jgi:hypothetical protein